MGAVRRFVQNPGKNAICYYRYSSDAQREASIDQQLQSAHEYAKTHGYHIIKEYEDKATSGTRDDREQYNLMLYEVEKLRPAYLILWKTDRLSRDKIDIVLAKKRLRECGVKIVYVAEAIPEDDEATEILLESIYEGMAAAFIAGHRKNVMRGLNYNAERCLYNGVKILGYKGEPDKKYEIDSETATIVKTIFDKYASGVPMKCICDELNSQGLTNYGREFNINQLRRILPNTAYVGVYKWGEHTINGGMPRIVDDDTFQRVQERLNGNKRGGKGALKRLQPEIDIIDDYWLTGHVYCGLCGASMQGISGTSKNLAKYQYYSCKEHRKHKCSMHNKKKEVLEKIVLYVLQEIVFDPTYRLLIAEKCYAHYKAQHDDGGVYEASIKSQLHEVETKIANLVKAIVAGILTPTTGERLRVLESTQDRLKDALIAEQNRQKCEIKHETIVKYLECFGGDLNNPDERRRILDEYIDKILVSEDSVTVSFYYTGKQKKLSIQETLESIVLTKSIISVFQEISPDTSASIKARESLLDESEEESRFF